MVYFARRLRPGEDLRKGILALIEEHRIEAGVIASGVGSFTHARMRLAGGDEHFDEDGPFEIVSMTGTVGTDGIHIHLSISDQKGTTFGGHLAEGCTINTTAEIVIAQVPGWRFRRCMDPATGYPEFSPERKD